MRAANPSSVLSPQSALAEGSGLTQSCSLCGRARYIQVVDVGTGEQAPWPLLGTV